MKVRKTLVGAAVGVVLAAGGVVGIAAPAQAATSGVDVVGYCKSQFGAQWLASAKAKDGNNPYSWQCTYGGFLVNTRDGSGVNMDSACRFTTGRSWATAYLSYWSAYGWRCSF